MHTSRAKSRKHPTSLRVFSELYRVREFRPVLCADLLYCITEDTSRALKHIVEAERVNEGLDYLLCELSIISESERSPHTRLEDSPAGYTGGWSISDSGL